jgi:hypothetical protein
MNALAKIVNFMETSSDENNEKACPEMKGGDNDEMLSVRRNHDPREVLWSWG